MINAATDELDALDEAFSGNRLLATLTTEARALIEPSASIVQLSLGEVIQESGGEVRSTLFPLRPTMISLALDVEGGRSVEVASVGHEGAIGGIVSCGHAPAFARAEVLVAGSALRVPLEVLEEVKARSGLVRNLFCRFSDFLLAQVMQSAACNAYHPIEQRAARWLLTAQDRSDSRIELTQEALAALLGVQRTTLNAVIGELAAEGLIVPRRGVIHIADRAGLKARSCECYDAIERHFADVIGPTGNGGSKSCD